MAYVIKFVSVKPAGVVWFSQSGGTARTTLANMAAWTKSQTGYLDALGSSTGVDSFEGFVIFDTQVNGDAWLSAKATQPDYVVHDAYFTAQGIVETVSFYP